LEVWNLGGPTFNEEVYIRRDVLRQLFVCTGGKAPDTVVNTAISFVVCV
jgi:hypothetical protein